MAYERKRVSMTPSVHIPLTYRNFCCNSVLCKSNSVMQEALSYENNVLGRGFFIIFLKEAFAWCCSEVAPLSVATSVTSPIFPLLRCRKVAKRLKYSLCRDVTR